MTDFQEEFIHIRTSEFLVEDGEEEELFNPGTYGSALSIYLESELNKRGYSGGAILEDWGYWIGVEDENENGAYKAVLESAVYCYNESDENPMEYVILVASQKLKKWSWKELKFISLVPQMLKLQIVMKDIIASAPNTEILSISPAMPS